MGGWGSGKYAGKSYESIGPTFDLFGCGKMSGNPVNSIWGFWGTSNSSQILLCCPRHQKHKLLFVELSLPNNDSQKTETEIPHPHRFYFLTNTQKQSRYFHDPIPTFCIIPFTKNIKESSRLPRPTTIQFFFFVLLGQQETPKMKTVSANYLPPHPIPIRTSPG